jgi:hypothetical protein
MRYRLRSLLFALVLAPLVIACGWWKYSAWKAERERAAMQRGDGRGWATMHGPAVGPETPIEQNQYWHHETITPAKAPAISNGP